jgi:hypothetical protein
MTRTNIPIRLRFNKIPVRWEIRTVKGAGHRKSGEYAFPRYLTEGAPEGVGLDAWECRREFFEVQENDNASLLRFLTKVGEFSKPKGELLAHWSPEVMQHYREGHPLPLDVRGLWKFRDNLRHSLVNRKKLKIEAVPSEINFDLHFELQSAAVGVVTIADAYRMLLVTVFVDIAKGLRFKFCKRKDCGQPFPLTSRRRKMFCNGCAHVVAERNRRERERKKKKTEKSERTRLSAC